MKIILCILIFLPLSFYSQSTSDDFYDIDNKVKSIGVCRLDSLANQLAALGKNEREKVRAFFRWITENIDYNVRPYYNRNRKQEGPFYQEPEDSTMLLPLNERVATKVLNKGLAFCDGYGRLFKVLCDYGGIKSEIIRGYARTGYNGRFSVNHTWNAVYIDNSWYLLDVTWASGVISYRNEYVRQYNNFYFLTSPEKFILDHYPEDPKWSLLPEMPVYKEFNQSPFRCTGFIKSGISSYFPSKGVIEVSTGDTILFEMKARMPIKSFFIASEPVPDTLNLQQSLYTLNNDMISVNYVIQPGSNEWLYIFCNDELALRYKLNIKKDVSARKPLTILK